MDSIIDILEKCNESYSNGDVYELTKKDTDIIKEILDIDVQSKLVDDVLYDTLYYATKAKYPTNKFFTKLTSNNTGYGEEIEHPEPMGSMDELKTGDWDKWKIGHNQFLMSEKLDGCSLVLYYKNGKLDKAATRGRGYKGKDVMRHIKHVSNIPQNISNKNDLTVRGELLCPRSDIEKMLQESETITGKKQKNGRNTIAGALNKKETETYIFNKVKFVAYWDSDKKGLAIQELNDYGFDVPMCEYINSTCTEEELINKVKTYINTSLFEIDGLILTQMDNIQEGFETGSINPKASRKFKMGITNNVATSTVVNIAWQVSKNGKLTPVLEIEPTEVCGSTITHITGHNYQNVIDKKCGIGATIRFTKSGLVIPYLQEVLSTSEEYNLTFDYYQDGVDIYARNNPEAVRESDIRQLEFFAKSLDVDQLGYANCKSLYEYYEMTDETLWPEKLCTETGRETFVSVLGVNGGKAYDSLHKKLEDVTEVEFAAASGAFGPSIGKRILQQVYNKYNKLVVTEDELRQVEGFGDSRVYQYMRHVEAWRETEIYLSNIGGINFKVPVQNNSGKLDTYTVCFTGIRDKELEKYIQDNGGKVSNTYTKSVNLLIVKDLTSTSSKMQKAKDNGCKILDIDTARLELMKESE